VKKLIVLASLLLICVFIITSCGGGETTTTTAAATTTAATTTAAKTTAAATTTAAPTATAAPTIAAQYGGIYKETFSMGGSSLDIGFPFIQPERYYLPCFEPLIRETYLGEKQPWLATTWKLADDLLSLTLTLRQDVKFQDGSDFNAAAVKWNLEMYMSRKKAGTENWKSVDVINNYSVQLNLNKYTNTLISFLAGADGFMESKEAYDKNGEAWLKQHPQGTGAFKYVSYDIGIKRTFTKNSNYWGKDAQGNKLPYLDGLETYYIADEMTRSAAVLNGDMDVAYGGGATVIYNNLKNAGYSIIPGAINPMCLWPSSVKPDSPWSNILVRQAMEYALDREAIAKVAEGGWGSVAYQLPPSFNAAYVPDLVKKRGYDVAKAKALLEQAGYGSGFTTNLYATTMGDQNFLLAVQSYAAAVGIKININRLASGAYNELEDKKGWEGICTQPLTSYLNYAQGLSAKLGPATADYQIFYSTKRPDGLYYLIDQAMTTREMEPAKVQGLTRLLWENVTCIPVYYAPSPYAVPSYVHEMGFQTLSNSLYYTPEKGWMSKKK
jgi:peptide/nickel transport system substrate-binding protein